MLQTPSKNSQLVAWLQEQQKPHRLREVMAKERHSQFIKQAEEKGYLLTPTIAFLLAQSRSDNGNAATDVDDLVQVQLSNMRLKDVGEVGICLNLQYCSLPGNYITNFDWLKSCKSLIRLDLHDNQISTLPGPEFWQDLTKLTVLYLHNNSIGKLSCLQNLGSSPNLQVLTLFDTPISLKKSYRHHVVNSIFALKALDFHVISDEEIIEDADFGSHFSAMHSSFQYHPLLNLKKERNLADEIKTVRNILLEVSLIQAKHSPVFIIQRYIRGFLGRCKARRFIASRLWAAVAIQRYWRKHKGYKYASKKLKKKAPEAAKVSKQGQKSSKTTPAITTLPAQIGKKSYDQSPSNREADYTVRSKLDYDTYMKNRRPGSISPGIQLPTTQYHDDVTPEENTQVAVVQDLRRKGSSTTTGRHRANIMIDLTKLEAATQLVPIDSSLSAVDQTHSSPPIPSSSSILQPQDIEKDASKLKAALVGSNPKQQKHVTVYEMLGPLDNRSLNREIDEILEEESPPIKFRISGLKSILHRGDPTLELLIERRETGKDMRSAHRDFIDTIPQPKRTIKKKRKPNANQRLFARIQGTMGMASLRAVQQAYKDREKAEDTMEKSDYVLALREESHRRRERRHSYLEEKRLTVLQKRDQDVCDMAEAFKQQATLKQDELEKAKEERQQKGDRTKSLKQEMLFTSDFNGQHTSISKALLKHDRQLIKAEMLQTKDRIVKTQREYQKSQAELVQRYLEHRKLMRQAQVAVERAALDSRILQEANDRLLQSQSRIVRQKQKRQTVQAFYPLPKSATDPILPAVPQEGKPNRFETLISMYDGRVGNHPSLLGQY